MNHNSDTDETGPLEAADADSASSDTVILPGGRLLRRIVDRAASGDDTLVGPKGDVILVVRGMTEVIPLRAKTSVILGRVDHRNSARPDVDLSRFGAAERGVSRQHARLEIVDNRLFVVDLGSSNGTFYRMQRLQPHQPCMLKRGDEIILGRLAMQVMFE
ncbi:MAG: FHA domain-containing protein [Aggregatilineales bacterium]